MKKKVQMVVKDAAYDFYYEKFVKSDDGVQYIVESFPGLYEKTLKETAGIFGRNELYMIIDAFEGIAAMPKESGACLKGECLAAFKEDRLGADWNVDGEKFKGKMDLITSFQAACLEMWAFSYWRGCGADPNTPKSDSDLEKHIKVLL
jgi:hypothetical protein